MVGVVWFFTRSWARTRGSCAFDTSCSVCSMKREVPWKLRTSWLRTCARETPQSREKERQRMKTGNIVANTRKGGCDSTYSKRGPGILLRARKWRRRVGEVGKRVGSERGSGLGVQQRGRDRKLLNRLQGMGWSHYRHKAATRLPLGILHRHQRIYSTLSPHTPPQRTRQVCYVPVFII